MRKILCAFLLLAFVLPARAEDDGTADILAMGDVLFPQAREWTAVKDLRSLQRGETAEITGAIGEAYRRAGISLDGAECDFAHESLGPDVELGSYRWLDMDGDGSGEDDLLYSGPIPCMEGGMTLGFVWDGQAYQATPNELARTEALRIRPGKDPQLLSFSGGCCADPVNVYRLGMLSVPMATGPDFTRNNVTVIEGTATPKQGMKAEAFTASDVLFVRSSPEVKDEYDPDMSNMMSHAIFGNQLRVYMAGAKGQVLARQKDGQGRMWEFVVMEADSEPLLMSDPYSQAEGGFAGWVLPGKPE